MCNKPQKSGANANKKSHKNGMFANLTPEKILNNIKLELDVGIHPKRTLLFFYEIQECPNALNSLIMQDKIINLPLYLIGQLNQLVI